MLRFYGGPGDPSFTAVLAFERVLGTTDTTRRVVYPANRVPAIAQDSSLPKFVFPERRHTSEMAKLNFRFV